MITGGPCSGKTTLLGILSGQDYCVVPETAELIIKDQLENGGDMVPSNPLRREEFQDVLMRRQLETEKAIIGDGLYILDRALPDNVAYNLLDGNRPTENLLDLSRSADYDCVFFLEQLPFYETSEVRKESYEDAKKLSTLLRYVYNSLGYDVVDVSPMGSANDRAEFIVDTIKNKGLC